MLSEALPGNAKHEASALKHVWSVSVGSIDSKLSEILRFAQNDI
jgi:hypothetical protein